MILDHLDNASAYLGVHPRVAAALQFLRNTDLAKLPVGKHAIQGEDVYALVSLSKTKHPDPLTWESHRKYIDVQCIVSGTEAMGHANISDLKMTKDYDAKDDYLLFSGSGATVTLKAGMFVVYFPQDGHAPGLAAGEPAEVKKVVVKARV
ncbi:MAG: YhcH/YjgK/YiaL family protein [Planctomycetes bacterium]|nr:YhcH/YjgK/YiaL family protein [Planctomycetota bacterium]